MTCKESSCKWFGQCVAVNPPYVDDVPTCYEIAPPPVETMRTNPRKIQEMIVSYDDNKGKTIRAIMDSRSQLRLYLFQLSEKVKFVKIEFVKTGKAIDGNRRTLLKAAQNGSLWEKGA